MNFRFKKLMPMRIQPAILAGLAILMLMVQLSGCGYRFAGSAANRLSSTDSVWVAFIKNETASTIAQTALRRTLLDELHAMRGMAPAASIQEADIQISGVLTGYGANAVSYSSLDRVREYRITVSVQFEVKRKGADKPFWKGSVQAYQDYPEFSDLAFQSNAADAALIAASRKVAEKLITALENSY